MDIFLAGTPVSLSIPLQDRSGNPIVADSVDYRVVDQSGAEVVARTPLASFVAGDSTATVDILASQNAVAAIPSTITFNQIDTFSVREVRTIELFVVVGGNTVLLLKSYAIEPSDPLVVGINSFQTFSQAELTALEVPNTPGWDSASDHDKIAALIEARQHLCQLNFWMLNSNVNWGQDSLNFVPEGSFDTPYAGSNHNPFVFNGNLSLLTPTNFARLPARFRAALNRAQLAEADTIIGGDPIDERRKHGVVVETIGEVKQMYRQSKPVDLPCSRRALKYISYYVSFGKKIGRG